MKSIGLYGDSFTGNIECESIKYHWSTKLAEHYNCNVTNYGESGTSIYFSYKKFLETYNKHDCHIFLVTHRGRYIKRVLLKDGSTPHVSNLAMVKYLNEKILEPKYNDLMGWYVCSDDEYEKDIQRLMLHEIQEMAPDTIFVPAFTRELSEKLVYDLCLMDLQMVQAVHYGKSVESIRNYSEDDKLMSGHFCPEMNNLLFDIIRTRIEKKVWDWSIPEIKFNYTFDELWKK